MSCDNTQPVGCSLVMLAIKDMVDKKKQVNDKSILLITDYLIAYSP